MTKNKKAKTVMLPHSEAKVDFYKDYLKIYLRVLFLSEFIDRIYIFDVFCGTGIYENGKKGSPIVALEAIQNLNKEFPDNDTIIDLIINDLDIRKLEKIEDYIKEKGNLIQPKIRTKEAYSLLSSISSYLKTHSTQTWKTRNLILIDPYGYKELTKEVLFGLMENGRTEIILFLPISHIQRFTQKALSTDEPAYVPLRNFVFSFFPENHLIRTQKVTAQEYIDYLSEALRFNKYYSTSYYIERDASNKYALFFITNNLYGLEKAVEVKWKSDGNEGRGWKQPKAQQNLFEQQDATRVQEENFLRLQSIILDHLKEFGEMNNNSAYEFSLTNNFEISLLIAVLKSLLSDQKIVVHFANSLDKKVIKKAYFTYQLHRQDIVKLVIIKA